MSVSEIRQPIINNFFTTPAFNAQPLALTGHALEQLNQAVNSLGNLIERLSLNLSNAEKTLAWNDDLEISAPAMKDKGGLEVDGRTVTTAGGYKISFSNKNEEIIVEGPDGKPFKVWGDPHLETGDGDKGDFYKNTSIHLKDGTILNFTTTDTKDGEATFTSSVQIISGNQQITVNGIDKNQVKMGEITDIDSDSFQVYGNRFYVGDETDDLFYMSPNGEEMIGVTGKAFGGKKESRAFNDKLADYNQQIDSSGGLYSWVDSWLKDFTKSLNDKPRDNAFRLNDVDKKRRGSYLESEKEALQALGTMFRALYGLVDMNNQLSTNLHRNRCNSFV